MPSNAKSLKPDLNFITLHYSYVIGMTLLVSVIMYGAGSMQYIDALFFASGCATQSGLNTIDVNLLPLYKQLTMYFATCMCTPIFINTSVVVIRLYWFEKRFQNVVIDRSGRRTRTISRSKTDATAERERDLGHEERGVGDREIRVMREENGKAKGGAIEDEHAFSNGNGAGIRTEKHDDDEDVDPFHRPETPVHQVNSNVVWADNLTTPREKERRRLRDSVESPVDRLPQKNEEQSIAFVEAQRQPKQKGTLRIPGPRDYERGII